MKLCITLLVLATSLYAQGEMRDPEGLQNTNMLLMFGLVFSVCGFL
ncbi:hypothetical protein [Chitinivibrio alkaliphilus]|uniref:Uncharacterized protein n=1 Tax=Chitinivibrio alkaliphilus ACht1 TaxID=1313304 RepID=U7D771_9BACT|nr:hypothetical protein [Chitinivibrio alkaliphilus]ERP31411.1 hypothetical protein CALK_1609 [Chitinivibrio alkaliphilus ACht1]